MVLVGPSSQGRREVASTYLCEQKSGLSLLLLAVANDDYSGCNGVFMVACCVALRSGRKSSWGVGISKRKLRVLHDDDDDGGGRYST
jgi:hypothetical protein